MEEQNRSQNRNKPSAGSAPARGKGGAASGQQRARSAPRRDTRAGAGNSRSERIRISAERRKRKKRRRDAFIIFVLLVMLGALAAVLCTTVFFKAEDIIVNNQVELYSEERIAEASGLSVGDNMLTANLEKAEDAIEKALPYIRVATVRRKWPNAFFIDAEYADTVLAVRKGGAYVYIDIDGKVLETDIAQPEVSAAVVTGAYADEAVPGSPVTFTDENALAMLLEVVSVMYENGVTNITAVDVSNPTDIVVELDRRIDVKLGSSSNVAEKITFGKAVIDKNINTRSDVRLIIDLTTDAKAFVREKEKPTEPTSAPETTLADGEEGDDYDEDDEEDYDEDYDEDDDYDEDYDEDYDDYEE